MNGAKLNKIINACIATGVLLLFILASVMVYQIVLIAKTKREIADLNREIEILEQQNQETSNEIDVWLNNWKITERANELGWLYGEDK